MSVPKFFALLALLMLSTAVSAQGLSAASTANCDVLYAELDALMEANGTYSLRLVHRADEYRSIVANLEELRQVPVPYAGEELDRLPVEDVSGLRSTTRTVTRTEPAPNYITGIGALGLGGLLLYSGAMMMQDEDRSSNDEGAGGVELVTLGGLLVVSGIYAFANTRTVRDEVPNEDAIRHNRQVRQRVEAANRRIRTENAERERKREERDEAIETNDQIDAERARLRAERDRYEQASLDQYEATMARLTDAGNRRCISSLEATGALVKLEDRFAEVYIVTRPLSRERGLLPEATEIDSLGFSVRTLRLREPLGALGSLDAPRRVELSPLTELPAGMGQELDGYLTRVPLALDAEPVDPDSMTAEGELVAEQDGRTFSAPFATNVTLIEP